MAPNFGDLAGVALGDFPGVFLGDFAGVFFAGVILGDFAGVILGDFAGVFFGDFLGESAPLALGELLCPEESLILGVSFLLRTRTPLGLAYPAGLAFLAAISDFFCTDLSSDVGVPAPPFFLAEVEGDAPFLTGLLGGSVLSMYSGDMYGPKETLLRGLDPPPGDLLAALFLAETGVFLGVGAFPLGLRILNPPSAPPDFLLPALLASFLFGVPADDVGVFLGLATAFGGGVGAEVTYLDPAGYSQRKERSPRVKMSLCLSSVALSCGTLRPFTLVGSGSMEVMNT